MAVATNRQTEALAGQLSSVFFFLGLLFVVIINSPSTYEDNHNDDGVLDI